MLLIDDINSIKESSARDSSVAEDDEVSVNVLLQVSYIFLPHIKSVFPAILFLGYWQTINTL